ILVDIALAESDGTTYIILFQTLADEYETLHFDVFEPVLVAFEPMASDTGEVVPVVTETPIEADADTDAELTVEPVLEPAIEATTEAIEETYEDPQELFSVPVPTNWTVEEGDGYVKLAAPAGDFTYTLVTVETNALTESISEAWDIAAVPEDAD